MADQDDEPSGILSGAHKAYDTVVGAINKIPTPGFSFQSSPHDQAIKDRNKLENDKRVQDATKTFTVKTSATAPTVVSKPVVKATPKKVAGKTY